MLLQPLYNNNILSMNHDCLNQITWFRFSLFAWPVNSLDFLFWVSSWTRAYPDVNVTSSQDGVAWPVINKERSVIGWCSCHNTRWQGSWHNEPNCLVWSVYSVINMFCEKSRNQLIEVEAHVMTCVKLKIILRVGWEESGSEMKQILTDFPK